MREAQSDRASWPARSNPVSVVLRGAQRFAWCVALAAPLFARQGERSAFVEVSVPRSTYFVGEPIRARLQLRFETKFLEQNLVPLFQRTLDVPVQVQWASAIEGADTSPGATRQGPSTRTFVLDETVVRAERSTEGGSEGTTFTVLELERSIVPRRTGRLTVPAPTLRFAYATEFREDFVHGRVAVDRHETTVEGTPRELDIIALPDEGRLEGFTGAIGRFEIDARASANELAVGDVFKIALRFAGEGNLADFPAPSLHRIDGLQLLGSIEVLNDGERIITYDFTPTSTRPREFPAVPFVFFDPTPPAGYSTLWTKPIPLTIRASAAASNPPPQVDSPPGIRAAGSVMVLAGSLVALLIGVVGLVVWLALRHKKSAPS